MRKPDSETTGLLQLVDTNSFFVDSRAPPRCSWQLMQAEAADSWLNDSAKENRGSDAFFLDEKQVDLDVNLRLCSSCPEAAIAEGNWSSPKVATEPMLEMLETEDDEPPYDPISAPWSPRPRYMRLKRNLDPAVPENGLPPYDPELNPLSPRPRFRKYNPNKRLEFLQMGAGLEQEFVDDIVEAEVGEQIFELKGSGSIQEMLDKQVNFCTSEDAHLVQEAGNFSDAGMDKDAEAKSITPSKSRWSRLLKMLVGVAIFALILWFVVQDPSLRRNLEHRMLTPKWDWTQQDDDQLSSLTRNYLAFNLDYDKEESPPGQPSAAMVAEEMDAKVVGSCFWSDWEESKREMCLNRTAMATARTAKAPAAEQDLVWVIPAAPTQDEEMTFPTPDEEIMTPNEEIEFPTPDEEMDVQSIERFEGANDASASLQTELEPQPWLLGRSNSIRFRRLLSALCGYISAVMLAGFLLWVFSWLIDGSRKAASTEKVKQPAAKCPLPDHDALQVPPLLTATNLASDSAPASFASEASLSPAVSRVSDYGSFTALEPLVLNRGEVQLTPVRRSSRLRSRISQAPCLRA